ncbi:MAG: glycosyltransferase family 4 protein [Lachnospiraceae bacterium]|nr:glycosyltransferase family 4 protein [Lachnospiraceae bacterium]
MKILWISNLVPAMVADVIRRKRSNKEGWVAGAMECVLQHAKADGLQLAVAFPLLQEENLHGKVRGLEYFGFIEDTAHPENYDAALVASLGRICEEYRPDVIHVYGTEFPHTLAMLRIDEWKKRTLVHLQGLMQPCTDAYFGGLPAEVTERATFRDVLRRDSLAMQKEKYERRAVNESEALALAEYACGRTAFDKEYFAKHHPDGSYFACNETLRSCFYEGMWDAEACSPHSIVMSQGNIPLKGAHVMIEALAILRKRYPDVTLTVAGDNILRGNGPMDALKRCGYGKYLREQIRRHGLQDAVRYVGQKKDVQMKELYLSSAVYVLPSFVENSPNSLGEAMMLGMPCVASRVGGIPSQASEGEVRFTEPGDAKGIAEAVSAIFEDREAAKELGLAGRKRAMLSYDREANYKMLLWIYDNIVKENQ